MKYIMKIIMKNKHSTQTTGVTTEHIHTHTPGTPVRHSILHAAQAGLLITHVHHAGTAQATAIGGRHRLLVYHDGCTFKDRRLVFKTGWRGAYMK